MVGARGLDPWNHVGRAQGFEPLWVEVEVFQTPAHLVAIQGFFAKLALGDADGFEREAAGADLASESLRDFVGLARLLPLPLADYQTGARPQGPFRHFTHNNRE